jgi:hypothetical protein
MRDNELEERGKGLKDKIDILTGYLGAGYLPKVVE